MLTVLLIVLLIVLYTFQSLFCKLYSAHYPGRSEDASGVFTFFYGAIVALLTFCVGGFTFHASLITVLFGIANGVLIFLYNLSLIRASGKGPYSLVMIFMLFGGLLIPLGESVALGTRLSAIQFAGIGIMLVALVFLNLDGLREKECRVSGHFLALCLLLFIANGCYGAILDGQQKILGTTAEKEELIILTFCTSALLALAGLITKKPKGTLQALKQTPLSASFLVVDALIATFAVNLYVYCMSLVDISILAAFDNGGVLLLSVLISLIFFHEKLKPAKAVGIVLALGSIVLLSLV